MTNPRPKDVMDQLVKHEEPKRITPLTAFKSKKCKDKELYEKGWAMDKCMFGESLDAITEELQSDPSRAIEETKFCEYIDVMVKCANSAAGKCFSKKVMKSVTELYMGMVAYAATQRLAKFQYDPGHLAKCDSFSSLDKKAKSKYVQTKTGAATCDMAAYYKELGLGLVCDMKVREDFDMLMLQVQLGRIVTEEEFMEPACAIRKQIVEECGKRNTCLDKKFATWLGNLQKSPIKVMFSLITNNFQEDFKWNSCPN